LSVANHIIIVLIGLAGVKVLVVLFAVVLGHVMYRLNLSMRHAIMGGNCVVVSEMLGARIVIKLFAQLINLI